MQIIVLQKKSQRMQHSNNDVLKPTKKKPKYSAKYITVTIKYTKDNCSTYLNSVRKKKNQTKTLSIIQS